MRLAFTFILLLTACRHGDRGGLYRFDGDGRVQRTQPFEGHWEPATLPVHQLALTSEPLTAVLKAHEKVQKRRSPNRGDLSTVHRLLTAWAQAGETIRLPHGLKAQQLAGFDKQGNVQFTGYYSPIISAARQRSERFKFPLYAHPPDWAPKGSYLTRRQIDGEGGLEGRGLELAWTEDRLSNFFMHVQGSGYVEFEDGQRLLLAYGGKNGRNYTSIGRLLVERGEVSKEEISMQAIKDWAAKNPAKVPDLLYECESYTFFRTGPSGPVGAGGEVVIAGLSVAVDPRVIPLGAVLLAQVPELDDQGRLKGHRWRLLFAQDTGAAIKGPGHIDLYVGAGAQAGAAAGRLHHYGRVWMLLPPSP